MTLQPQGYFPGPPDLAVEVLSPSDSRAEIEAKVADWLTSGCRLVLVLNPATRTAELHRRTSVESFTSPEVVTFGDVVSGCTVDLADLFR
jgi:Uma2 family endonuclease